MPNEFSKKTFMPKDNFICASQPRSTSCLEMSCFVTIQSSSSARSEHMNDQGNWKNTWTGQWCRVAVMHVCVIARWRAAWSSVQVPATLIWSIIAKYGAPASFFIQRRIYARSTRGRFEWEVGGCQLRGRGWTKGFSQLHHTDIALF
jgi:hypothetical protein